MDSETAKQPKTARGRDTRQRIVHAAARLMHVQGVAGTSVDQVLEEADAGKGQFYHYFTDKAELVGAVLEHQMALTQAREASLLEELDSWQGIRAWFDLILASHAARGFLGGCPVGSLAAEMADRDDDLRAALAEAFQGMCGPLRDGLAAMQDRGALDPEADPETLAHFSLAAIQGGLLLAATSRDAAPLKAALDQAFARLRSFGS